MWETLFVCFLLQDRLKLTHPIRQRIEKSHKKSAKASVKSQCIRTMVASSK